MVQFKLQHRGLVRKVTFKNVDQPSWHELSWKIGDVCNIPHAAVALTYLDPDGDKITISSQAELKEYYSSLDEDDLDSNVPHKFIVRNLNDGIPDPDAADPSEDNFLLRDARTMAASTVGGGSQWGFNAEDEAERDPAKLRLSGYSTFADALSPLAGSATEPEDDRSEKDELPGGFNAKPQTEESPPAPKTSSGWGLPLPGFGWGRNSAANTQTNTQTNTQPAPSPPPADPDTKSSNPWASNNIEMAAKTPSWAAASATTPTSTKAPPTPWGAPASVATGGAVRPGFGGKGGAPTASTTAASGGSTARPTTLVPPPVAPTVQMDSMVADRASSYAASPAVFPKGGKKNKKRMTHREREAERQREEEARREESRVEEAELRAMEREAERERQENARYSAEAAARAAAAEARRVADRELEWEREHERLNAEEEQRKRDPPRHAHQNSNTSSEWQHVHVQEQNDEPEQEDEEAYRARIEAARANVFGTAAPPPAQSQPRPRKVSTRSKSEKSSGKSSRPNSKVYPPTPAPKRFFDSDLISENGQSSLNAPNDSGHVPTTPGYSAPVTPGRATDSKAQVCNDVADLLGSFKRILDSEPDLLDAIREAFARGPASGALNATFGNRSLSPEMLRIVSSVDELLTKILPNHPAASPYVPSNMELEPRIPTPSVTPTPVVPAEPEFGVPPSDYGSSFEYSHRGRQGGVPVINVPRPKYPASSLTREGYSTGTTPPATSSGYSYTRSGSSPERSAHGRSRSRPPPGDFEIVPPSYVPPQARMVIPPPVVPGEETDESPITPGFARKSDGGLMLANSSQQGPASIAKADMENARHHYKSQRELYKLEKAERKKEMEERAAAKAERRRAKAANADPNIADLRNQLGDIVPPRPYEAERGFVENPYENPRSAAPYSNSARSGTVYAEGLGKVTLMPVFPSAAAVTAPVSPVREDATTPGFERARRRRQSLNASPERFHPPPSVASRSESYHSLQPDAYPGAAHHAPPYVPAQPPQHDLAKRVALKLTEMGYTPQKYPTLPSIVGHRIRPIMNTHGVNENELAYLIVQDLFKYSGQS